MRTYEIQLLLDNKAIANINIEAENQQEAILKAKQTLGSKDCIQKLTKSEYNKIFTNIIVKSDAKVIIYKAR